jgi:hypothetical protein
MKPKATMKQRNNGKDDQRTDHLQKPLQWKRKKRMETKTGMEGGEND